MTVVWLDGDLSMPPEDIPRLLAGIGEGNDIVVGSRFVKGGSSKRTSTGGENSALSVLVSTAGNRFLQVVLGGSLLDHTAGFVAIRRSVLQDLGLRGDYGEYRIDLVFRASRAGHRVLEVPYVSVPRQRGVSKTAQGLAGYIRRGRKYVSIAPTLRWEALREDGAARARGHLGRGQL